MINNANFNRASHKLNVLLYSNYFFLNRAGRKQITFFMAFVICSVVIDRLLYGRNISWLMKSGPWIIIHYVTLRHSITLVNDAIG